MAKKSVIYRTLLAIKFVLCIVAFFAMQVFTNMCFHSYNRTKYSR